MPTDEQKVRSFLESSGLTISPEARALDLVSEAGEVAKEVLKGTTYGTAEFTATEGWAEELGDTCFSLYALAISTGVDLSKALETALSKYQTAGYKWNDRIELITCRPTPPQEGGRLPGT